MKRREFLTGLAAASALGASPAFAQGVVDEIVRQLRRQGFKSVMSDRTLLGRVRIVAERKDGRREIIVNPRTGEILRDLWTSFGNGAGRAEIVRDRSGSDDDDDRDDDKDDVDDSDDDDSGGSDDDGDDDD